MQGAAPEHSSCLPAAPVFTILTCFTPSMGGLRGQYGQADVLWVSEFIALTWA